VLITKLCSSSITWFAAKDDREIVGIFVDGKILPEPEGGTRVAAAVR
jgi:hypothetical protein